MWQSSRFRYLVQFIKIGDFFLILCLLVTSVISWTALKRGNNKAKYCIVSVNGKDVYKLELVESQKVKLKGVLGESLIEISNGGVRMLDSVCPLKICTHQGVINRPGQTIICVPNRIMIRITGEQEVDAITW